MAGAFREANAQPRANTDPAIAAARGDDPGCLKPGEIGYNFWLTGDVMPASIQNRFGEPIMKKTIVAGLTALALAFTLSACGDKAKEAADAAKKSAEQAAAATKEAAAKAAEAAKASATEAAAKTGEAAKDAAAATTDAAAKAADATKDAAAKAADATKDAAAKAVDAAKDAAKK